MSREFLTPTKCGLTIIKINPNNVKKVYYFTNEKDSKDYESWYPASSIKFVPAILAGKRLSESGFTNPDNLDIYFHYHSGGDVLMTTWGFLIDQALRPSKNIQYNELVILAGHFIMNKFLIENNYDIAMNRPYQKSKWKKMTGLQPATTKNIKTLFKGPKIVVKDRVTGKEVTYKAARPGALRLDKNRSTSASTLSLAEFLGDFIFNKDKFNLHENFYNTIKDKMSERKPVNGSTNQEVFVDEIKAQLVESEWNIYHKPGYLREEREDNDIWHYWVDVIVLESKSDPVSSSYAICAYGKEKKSVFTSKNIDTKIKHQSMLNSKIFDNTHLGIAEGIGRLIKEGEL